MSNDIVQIGTKARYFGALQYITQLIRNNMKF